MGGWVGEGLYRCTTQPLREVPEPAERAPEGLQGLEWVGSGAGIPLFGDGGGDGPGPPFGPGRSPLGPSLSRTLQIAASQPIRARFLLISRKVSQNRVVSPKYHEKAYVSPYFQNGLRKSALDFPRFPYLLAFSHKELMGVFCT